MSVTTRVVAAAATLLIATPAFAQPIAPLVQKRIDRILKRTPLIDGHGTTTCPSSSAKITS
jgi:membrane dipeptidase